MNLKIGDQAPDFKGQNQDEKTIQLSDFKGQKLVLFFYPKDNTPGCTAEACNLRDYNQELKAAGFALLGVSPDTIASHQKFIAKQNLNMDLITDPDKEILQAYDAWGEKKMYGKSYMGVLRTTFVIDEKGKIAHIIEKVKTKEHAEQILDWHKSK
ncbi:MAG: thioredoxin-dependent thiol peroxidase [Bacteroidales bacterium]|nr:thioredoxin-dependent thiol peroxidase [Bacteroidales bacterium]